MRYATIGTSWITESFISAAKTVPGITLAASYSRDEQRAAAFAAKNGAEKFYTDLEKLAADPEIDSVYIASPNRFHYEQSRKMLLTGKNVLCEKPAATTEEQIRELIALAEERGLIYSEAIMSIHTPAFTAVKDALGRIGEVRSAHIDYCQLSSKYPAYLAGKNPNIFNPEMHAGCLMDIGVYNLYLAAALFGMPEKIYSSAVFLDSGADSNGAAIFVYPSLNVSLTYSKTGQNYAPSEIIGDTGTIGIQAVSQLTGCRLITKTGEELLAADDISRDEVMSGEAAYFKRMTDTKEYSDPEYIFSKNTALTVRQMCDIIRKQNGFPF